MKPVFAALLLCAAAPHAVQAALPVPKHLISPDTPRIEDPETLSSAIWMQWIGES